MSHIFDALQRSEAEGDGSETAPARSAGYPPATELLQAAERKMQMRAAAAGVVSGTPSNGTDANGNGRHDHAAANSSELDQFPTLPVSILPSSRLVSVGAEESLGAEKFRFLAVKLRQLGAFGLVEMVTFIVVLGIGYAYVWKKGGFTWK